MSSRSSFSFQCMWYAETVNDGMAIMNNWETELERMGGGEGQIYVLP